MSDTVTEAMTAFDETGTAARALEQRRNEILQTLESGQSGVESLRGQIAQMQKSLEQTEGRLRVMEGERSGLRSMCEELERAYKQLTGKFMEEWEQY